MQRTKIDACVEAICNKGCQEVRQDISLLEQGDNPPELKNFTNEERMKVLTELKTIMAVYGDTCRIYNKAPVCGSFFTYRFTTIPNLIN
ncbi:hypothetical protein [Solemya velesiana gill symbiont]|uniref:Uncharacterized protein n=1 Tax=Solemya velesiana gill symbiont TaxID=1918948 RepID=A0A1T2KNI4_9GAMM|nr:hypothetical protein [Solemya velesiana gill symbiont]OOZ34321.1 hypothetical protein BOW51_12215 [Solemya velesiana gill symbiont]